MRLNSAPNTYEAFSLIEMLLVMAIFIILMAVGFLSVSDVTASMAVNNSVTSLEEDLRYAKRSAMFLDREVGEDWIYGIGIDFSNIESGEYNLFKWCSEYANYDSRENKMSSELPSWDPEAGNISNGNGFLPTYGDESCTGQVHDLAAITRELSNAGPGTSFNSRFLQISLQKCDAGGVEYTPTYVLYESSTGRAFLYNSDRKLLNYVYGDGDMWNNKCNVAVRIQRKSADPESNSGKLLKVYPVSGRVQVE